MSAQDPYEETSMKGIDESLVGSMTWRGLLHVFFRPSHYVLMAVRDSSGMHWVCTCDREYPLLEGAKVWFDEGPDQ